MRTQQRGSKSTVIIPCAPEFGGEFPTMNETIAKAKSHWGAYSGWKKQYTNRVAAIMPAPKAAHACVCVHFEWYRADMRTDPDNVASAAKYVIDGIVKSGLLRGDGWKHVRRIEHDFYVDKQKPRVVVILTEL